MFGFFRKRTQTQTQTQAADFLRAAAEAEAESQGEIDVIRACRELFGPAPRPLPAPGDAGSRLALTPEVEELFAGTGDEMLKILEDQETLLAHGQVVWGQLVQANSVLFEADNPHPLPANAVYSLDPFFDGRLSVLASIAGGLFAQKNTTAADRELREFVRVVTDERERILRKELPRGYCGGRSVYFTTCFVQPGHLPGNRLARPSFPLVVCPERTEAVMLLPCSFWPPQLLAHWRD